ncbi:Na/Pi cotransporter family protein [Luteimonas sp. SDU101]|uniref:Na/Pi cotransporter family protein n=1 Tax=Luteimonas sp. SDU101 TaxID=3422593 RepID=UPI003EB9DE47
MGSKPRVLLLAAVVAVLTWSFWQDAGWLQLCAGLAMFLFGMQCLEEGLRQLAGGRLEQLLARSTGTPVRGLLFGIGGTVVLQSSTLVSLLAIAFISSGLIGLAGGLAIVFGANLGATSGIWLLALAGHDFSLSPLALPLLVFGVLAGFIGAQGRAGGRVVLGVAFVFLGIDQVKSGFDAFGGNFDPTAVHAGGAAATLLFALVGTAATVVLQSSHATLMLILAALAAGQLELGQALALAIGSNVGSSVSTGVVGALGGNRSGQRLALAHVLFNVTTAAVALALLPVLAWLVARIAGVAGFGANPLLQLALFHTLFNAMGVALFWPWQTGLARWLERRLPERPAQAPAAMDATPHLAPVRARHLSGQALDSADAAAAAVALELRHLAALSLEVICRALGLPLVGTVAPDSDDPRLSEACTDCPDAEMLYRQRVKGVYADLLAFMGRVAAPMDQEHQRFWTQSQMAAAQMVEAVKGAKHLQKNLLPQLRATDTPQRRAYVALRLHLFGQMCGLHGVADGDPAAAVRAARLESLETQAARFEAGFRQRIMAMVGRGELDGLQAGSLLNDLGYVEGIDRNLRGLAIAEEPSSLRALRRLSRAAGTDAELQEGMRAPVENAN